MAMDKQLFPWDYFSTWNNQFDVKMALPDVLFEEEKYDGDLDIIFFDKSNEKKMMERRDILLYGRNFTSVDLANCPTSKDNINIADALEKLVSSDTNYLILSLNSYVAGLPFELLSRDLFSNTVFYVNEYFEAPLIRNINLYKYARKSVVLSEYSDTIVDKRMQGCIVIINDVMEDDGKKYIDNYFTVELEEFIAINSTVVYVFLIQAKKQITIEGFNSTFASGYTILVNKDFNIMPVANKGGLNYFSDRTLKSMLVKSLPVAKMEKSIYGKTLKGFDIADFDLLEFKLPAFETIPEGSWKKMLEKLNKSLPEDEIKDPKEKVAGYNKWVLTFVRYLLFQLKYSEADIKELSQNILSLENRKRYWVPSIINESYNAENNYEQLETVGDKVLGSSFAIYLMTRMPKITSESINNLTDHYMSKHYQAVFCKELGLNNWILTTFPQNVDIQEDVFESFSGALYMSAENSQRGLGSVLLYKFVEILFEHRDVESPEVGMGNKSMVIYQYTQKLARPNIFINQKYVKAGVFYNILRINPEYLSFFTKNGIDGDNMSTEPMIGKGSDDKRAKLDSHTQMYNYLKSIGVTYEWVENYRNNRRLLSNKTNKELYAQARVISVKQGYLKIYPKVFDKYTDYIGAILVGINRDDKHFLLSVEYINKSNNIDAKDKDEMLISQLLKKYISSAVKA